METLREPEGIKFYSIKTGETYAAKLEPTITALINSSDMGINASRGQDFGWRLHADWVKKVRQFRADEDKMDALSAKLRLEEGEAPSLTQILYYIYGRQVRAYVQSIRETENPFEEEYQQAISTNKQKPAGGRSRSKKHLEAAMEDQAVTEAVSGEDLPKKTKPSSK